MHTLLVHITNEEPIWLRLRRCLLRLTRLSACIRAGVMGADTPCCRSTDDHSPLAPYQLH